MALRKNAEDQWTSNGVIASFTIDMPDVPASGTTLQRAICGWGWSFACSIRPHIQTKNLKSRGKYKWPTQTTTVIVGQNITVIFDPHLIAGASYGQVNFEIVVQNLVRVVEEPLVKQITLPAYGGSSSNLAVYMRPSGESAPAMLQITTSFSRNIGLGLPIPRDLRAERALVETIHGAEMAVVKFYAYTRREEGHVASPRPLFAKLALLEGRSTALDTFLSAFSVGMGFKESEFVDLDVDNCPAETFAEYDYASDSDLDDLEGAHDFHVQPHCIPLPESESSSPASKSIDLTPSTRPSSPDALSPPVAPQEIGRTMSMSTRLNPHALPLPPGSRRIGRVMVIHGYAFKTWNAFLHYLYTNQMSFYPLGPSISRLVNDPNVLDASIPPMCSVKSMYKLADEFGLEDLKSRAVAFIRSQLSTQNIVRETFSIFTSLFPEIQEVEINFLAEKISDKTVTANLETMLKGVCDEERPHCFHVLKKIVWNRLHGAAETRF